MSAPFKPGQVVFSTNPITQAFIGTLGHAELEFCAALVTLWHQHQKLEEWSPVSRADIGMLLAAVGEGSLDDENLRAWGRNPFWRPDPHAFAAAGYIDWPNGSSAEHKGALTPKFFEALAREHMRRRECGIYSGLRE